MINYLPLQITQHAKERLKERYGYTELADVNSIISCLSQINRYFVTVVNKEYGTVVRQIRYKGEKIQAIVDIRNNKIITFIPELFDLSPDNIKPEIVENESIDSRLTAIENTLLLIMNILKKEGNE